METITSPISFTEKALKEVKIIMNDKSVPNEYGLRVGVQGGGCSGMSYMLGFDKITDNDESFDFDGVPSPGVDYIDEGVIKDFAYNLRNAKKLGAENNGKDIGTFPLFTAPSMKAGTKSEEDLISSIDDGVYITNLFYTNFIQNI